MNLVAAVAELLSGRLGLSPELLGEGVIERALDAVLEKAGPEQRAEKAARLLAEEGDEWQLLVDEVIVPETWFFRDNAPFHLLASHVREKWGPANPDKTFRALCIPCASGEEPYSVAMTLLDAGLDKARIRIDAGDVSERALARAKLAIYGKASFREKAVGFGAEYFADCEKGRRLREDIVPLVRFKKANLLDVSVFEQNAPYDAIFCRNAVIYLAERARREVVRGMDELLHEDGLLFTGHSELTYFCEAGYVPVDFPRSFACRKGERTGEAASENSPDKAVLPVPVQRTPMPVQAAPSGLDRSEPVRAASQLPSGFEQAEQLADRGDLEAATAICQGLVAGGTQDPEVYALLGVINESAGNNAPAEEFFRKALYLAPDHYVSLLHMSLLCERRGDLEASRLYRARAGRSLSQQEGNQVPKGS